MNCIVAGKRTSEYLLVTFVGDIGANTERR